MLHITSRPRLQLRLRYKGDANDKDDSSFSIIGIPELAEELKNWASACKKNPTLLPNWLYLSLLELLFFNRN